MTQTGLTASALWRAELCPASVVLPQHRRVYQDAEKGKRDHAALEADPPPGSIPEVAYVYNVLSGEAREVGRSIGRNYGELAEGDIPGTADLVTMDGEIVRVTDYKTGHGYHVAPPTENLQLQHNCLCAALVNSKFFAEAEIIYTRTGEAPDHLFDVFDFAGIKARLRAIWTATQAKEPAVVPDPQRQCWRCPAKKACPIMGRK